MSMVAANSDLENRGRKGERAAEVNEKCNGNHNAEQGQKFIFSAERISTGEIEKNQGIAFAGGSLFR